MRHHPHRPSDDHPGDHIVVFDTEAIVDEEPTDGSFPKWPKHRPVVASFLSASITDAGHVFSMNSVVCASDGEQTFYEQVNELMPSRVTSVSVNGRGYDMAVLQLGAAGTRAFQLEGLSEHARAHRYGRTHCDIIEMWSNYGSAQRPSLAEICGRLDIPVKTSVHGSDVGALWRAGEVEAIVRYCEEDVAATYCAWLHWDAWRHSDEALLSRPMASFARWIETTPAMAHLSAFATQPAALWARPRALAFDVNRALEDAERRVAQAETDRLFGRTRGAF